MGDSNRMEIDNTKEIFVIRLRLYPITNCAQIVADMQIASWLYAR